MFMPTLCAVVVQKLIYKAPLKKPLRINFRLNRTRPANHVGE
jgi:hypothetical protein